MMRLSVNKQQPSFGTTVVLDDKARFSLITGGGFSRFLNMADVISEISDNIA